MNSLTSWQTQDVQLHQGLVSASWKNHSESFRLYSLHLGSELEGVYF